MADYSPPASHPIIRIGPRGGLIVGQRVKDGKTEYDYQRPEHQHLGAGPHREAPYRRPVQQSLFDAPRTLVLKPPEEPRRRAAEQPQGDLFGAVRTVAVANPAPPSGQRVAKLAKPLPWAAVQHHEPEPAAAPAPKAEWKAPEPTPAAAKLEGQTRERAPSLGDAAREAIASAQEYRHFGDSHSVFEGPNAVVLQRAAEDWVTKHPGRVASYGKVIFNRPTTFVVAGTGEGMRQVGSFDAPEKAEGAAKEKAPTGPAPVALSEKAREILRLALEMPLDPQTGRPQPLNYGHDDEQAKELVAAGFLRWNGKEGWNGAEYADLTPEAEQWFHDRIAASGREKKYSAGQISVLQARHDFRLHRTRGDRSLEGRGQSAKLSESAQEAISAAEKRVAELEDQHGMAPSTVDGFRRRFKIPEGWKVHPVYGKPARFSVQRPGGDHYRIVIQGNDVGGSGRAYFESHEYLGAPAYHFTWSSTQRFGKGWQPLSEAWPKYTKWAKDQDARDAKHERDHAAMLEEQRRR